jgi:hypothetical protein
MKELKIGSTGALECWSTVNPNDVFLLSSSITPILHYSITPIFVTPFFLSSPAPPDPSECALS